ncbi:3'(2'),5'-bisphosphate nucleotidase CysQ [Cognatishimia sp. F0-27]|uniref:inositol monophosphatase family protein n=1 Tax=Cognatishimia sp. F0-27 TaxID=2816855 RepID=UPI001D0C26ED|nr:3'(2'),5'-bisphosphate nucleotidase CysQ [Cognatishimia sp. F0-27]MCC1492213.1 3'(2'),5'-bisphosphate nucleotidase CysQ [Cognatishimia sp. F0-27]
MSTAQDDLSLLIRAADSAGAVALSHHKGALDIRYKSHDQSPVTDADHAVNARLEEILRDARPGYGWLSEESPDSAERLDTEHVFIVDPIDGTRSFIDGSRSWAHSIAVARNGAVTAAVVYMPARGFLYAAARGRGATLNGAAIRPSAQRDLEAATVLATKPTMRPEHWRDGIPSFQRNHRPSLAYRLSLVAEGRFDAMLTLRPAWEWDIAAGSLILSEAGAAVGDRRGAPLRFNNPHPQTDGVVTANPVLHDALLARLW